MENTATDLLLPFPPTICDNLYTNDDHTMWVPSEHLEAAQDCIMYKLEVINATVVNV